MERDDAGTLPLLSDVFWVLVSMLVLILVLVLVLVLWTVLAFVLTFVLALVLALVLVLLASASIWHLAASDLAASNSIWGICDIWDHVATSESTRQHLEASGNTWWNLLGLLPKTPIQHTDVYTDQQTSDSKRSSWFSRHPLLTQDCQQANPLHVRMS